MSTVDKIKADLKSLEEREAELRARLEEVAESRRELETTLSVLQRYESDGRPNDEPEGLSDPSLSIEEGAKLVLKEHGGPMSTGQIVDTLWDSGFQYDKERKQLASSLRGVLSRGSKEGGPFVRVKRGVYGLTGRDEPEDSEQEALHVEV